MKNNQTELKPCPFCGNRSDSGTYGMRKLIYVIECIMCKIGFSGENKKEVTDKWNTRSYEKQSE